MPSCARYLREVPTYTAADIHELMHGSKLSNSSEPASRWKREKRVYAVPAGPAQLFPRFQFADGYPRPAAGHRPDDPSCGDGRMDWPIRGVYSFFEPGDSPAAPSMSGPG